MIVEQSGAFAFRKGTQRLFGDTPMTKRIRFLPARLGCGGGVLSAETAFVPPPTGCFRHPSARRGYDIQTVQELLGHKDVETTMVYTRVLNRGPSGVRSPVDGL
jgi:integrase